MFVKNIIFIKLPNYLIITQRKDFLMEKSYIKLFRDILQWSWYSDTPTFRVFIHLLLTANFADKKWRNIIIKRGERVISYRKLANSLKLSIRQTRTAIDHLKSTHEVTCTSTNKYTIISIPNYDKYQINRQTNDNPADKRATNNRQQYKNDNKNDNKNDKREENYLALDEFSFKEDLRDNFPAAPIDEEITKMKDWLRSKGETREDYAAFARNWLRKAKPKEKEGIYEV